MDTLGYVKKYQEELKDEKKFVLIHYLNIV